MFFLIESELPNGTRLKLQRDRAVWVATLASSQFVIRPGEVSQFIERAREWCGGNVAGASLVIAYGLIRHFASIVSEVDAAEVEQFDLMRRGAGGGQ